VIVVEVMPPNTNRGWFRLGGRKLAAGSCRNEVVAASRALTARNGVDVFTVCDVYQEMVQAGTRYAECTVFKTMQRMKEPPERPPFVLLERAGREGFRLALGV